MKAMRQLYSRRPPPDQVQAFLVAVLNGDEPPPVPPVARDSEEEGVYEYFKSNGVFALLKPALLAVDKHRPDDAKAYLSTFLGTAVTAL